MKKAIILLFIFFIILSPIFSSAVSVNGKLKVTGLQLVNECDNAVLLRGVSSHGLQWYGTCITDAALDFIANTMNADIFRIAMYVEQNGYLADPAGYTAMVDSLVDRIGARGMYALIDWHVLYVAGQSSGDPNSQIAAARTFWEHEAAQHKNKPYVLYEICNEPSPDRATVTWAMIKQYANDIIPRIRAIDPDTVIICGTPNWSQLGAEVVSSPLSYNNLMYTFHFYAGSHTTSMLTPYVGSLPIFCTEWGAADASGVGSDDYVNAQNFLDIMGGANTAGVKISWASWSWSDSTDSTSLLTTGTCPGGPFNTAHLSTSGNFVRNNIMTPGKTFICNGINSPTPTFTATVGPTPAQALCGTGITIDGNLNDAAWQTGTWTGFSRLISGTNPAGASARFKVRQDTSYLYAAVDVTTSTPHDDSTNYYDDDSVEIYLDMLRDRSATYNPGALNDFMFHMRYNDTSAGELNSHTTGVMASSANTAGGYSVEIAIPWTTLNTVPSASAYYGFDVGINIDTSGGTPRDGTLMWSGDENNWQNTGLFGDIQMGSLCGSSPTETSTIGPTFTITPTFTAGPPAAPELIDDIEDANNAITNISGRNGYWFTFDDGTGTQTLSFNSAGHTGLYSAHDSSTGFTNYGAFGFNFTEPAGAYNAAMYTGIEFWARIDAGSDYYMRVNVTDGNTIADYDYFGYQITNLSTSWQHYIIPFSSLTQLGTGTAYPSVDKTRLYSVEFRPDLTYPLSVYIDDIKFYPNVAATVTGTPPNTATQTPTFTATKTITPTGSATATKTITESSTETVYYTATHTPTVTETDTPTFTYTNTPYQSPTESATITLTVTQSHTATITATQPAATVTNSISTPATFTHTPTRTNTPVPNTPTITPTHTQIIATPVIEEIAYPNPYNPETGDLRVAFNLKDASSDTVMKIYSTGFRLVADADFGSRISGFNVGIVDRNKLLTLANGVYYYTVVYKTTNGTIRSKIKQFILLR